LIVIWIKLLSSTGGAIGTSDKSSATPVREYNLAEREDGLAARDIERPALLVLVSEQ
jgi:hypothetical protein